MPYKLPSLSYKYLALEPHIDEQTMRIHHTKHHAGYVVNLNEVLKDYPGLQKLNVEELIGILGKVPQKVSFKLLECVGYLLKIRDYIFFADSLGEA